MPHRILRPGHGPKSCAGHSLKTFIYLFALLAAAAFPARGAETYDGTPVGFTEDGYPYRGKPDAAVTITEYSDYLCPYCARHFQQTLPALLEKYVRPGKVKFVFADFRIASLHPQAPAAAESALCVAEQGAALFWAMHDKIFESRNRWAQASPDDLLPELAASVGADMTAYQACVQSGRQKDRVDAAIAAAQELGFNATPSFRFQSDLDEENYTFAGAQSIDKFSEWIDAMLAGEPQPVSPPRGKAASDSPPSGLCRGRRCLQRQSRRAAGRGRVLRFPVPVLPASLTGDPACTRRKIHRHREGPLGVQESSTPNTRERARRRSRGRVRRRTR